MRGDVVILHRKPGMTQLAVRPVVERTVLSERLTEFLDEQERLCSQLETVADALPNNVCWMRCTKLADTMGLLVRKAHRFEEERIFPLLSQSARLDDAVRRSITRLEWEHMEDEGYADEIAEALSVYADKTRPAQADNLGYMLRGFFESMRRHIAFEREFVLPFVKATETGGLHV